MSYLIARPINGISINGNEYALGNDGQELKFDSYKEAEGYILKNGYTQDDIDNCCVFPWEDTCEFKNN